jgi:hypothetical protein
MAPQLNLHGAAVWELELGHWVFIGLWHLVIRQAKVAEDRTM